MSFVDIPLPVSAKPNLSGESFLLQPKILRLTQQLYIWLEKVTEHSSNYIHLQKTSEIEYQNLFQNFPEEIFCW